ncbi:MAG: hypothetical protein R2939_01085 [Kofleriaceae bacterium]
MTETRLHAIKSETRDLAERDRFGPTGRWLDEDVPWQLSDRRFFIILAVVAATLATSLLLTR